MYCPYCGKKLPDEANFCPSCGKKLTVVQDIRKKMGKMGKANDHMGDHFLSFRPGEKSVDAWFCFYASIDVINDLQSTHSGADAILKEFSTRKKIEIYDIKQEQEAYQFCVGSPMGEFICSVSKSQDSSPVIRMERYQPADLPGRNRAAVNGYSFESGKGTIVCCDFLGESFVNGERIVKIIRPDAEDYPSEEMTRQILLYLQKGKQPVSEGKEEAIHHGVQAEGEESRDSIHAGDDGSEVTHDEAAGTQDMAAMMETIRARTGENEASIKQSEAVLGKFRQLWDKYWFYANEEDKAFQRLMADGNHSIVIRERKIGRIEGEITHITGRIRQLQTTIAGYDQALDPSAGRKSFQRSSEKKQAQQIREEREARIKEKASLEQELSKLQRQHSEEEEASKTAYTNVKEELQENCKAACLNLVKFQTDELDPFIRDNKAYLSSVLDGKNDFSADNREAGMRRISARQEKLHRFSGIAAAWRAYVEDPSHMTDIAEFSGMAVRNEKKAEQPVREKSVIHVSEADRAYDSLRQELTEYMLRCVPGKSTDDILCIRPVAYPVVSVEITATGDREEELRFPEKTVLSLLDAGAADVSELASCLGLDESTAQGAMQRLEEDGLVSGFRLTDRGREALQSGREIIRGEKKYTVIVDGVNGVPLTVRDRIAETVYLDPEEICKDIMYLETAQGIWEQELIRSLQKQPGQYLGEDSGVRTEDIRTVRVTGKRYILSCLFQFRDESAPLIYALRSGSDQTGGRDVWKPFYVYKEDQRQRYHLDDDVPVIQPAVLSGIKNRIAPSDTHEIVAEGEEQTNEPTQEARENYGAVPAGMDNFAFLLSVAAKLLQSGRIKDAQYCREYYQLLEKAEQLAWTDPKEGALRIRHILEKLVDELLEKHPEVKPDVPMPMLADKLEALRNAGLLPYSDGNGTRKVEGRAYNIVQSNIDRQSAHTVYYHWDFMLRSIGNAGGHLLSDLVRNNKDRRELIVPDPETILCGLKAFYDIFQDYYSCILPEPFDPQSVPIGDYIVLKRIDKPVDRARSHCLHEYYAFRRIGLHSKRVKYAIIREYDQNMIGETSATYLLRNCDAYSYFDSGVTVKDLNYRLCRNKSEYIVNFFLVFEFDQEVRPLKDYLDTGEIGEDKAGQMELCIRTAEFLNQFHTYKEPIYHRSLTYDSVVVAQDGEKNLIPYIIKFDFAKITDIHETVFQNLHEMNTDEDLDRFREPDFMGDTRVWEKTDIFSLGILFVDILTGRCSKDHRLGRPFMDELRREGWSEELIGIISRMTDIEPTRRPSAAQVIEALKKVRYSMV